VSWFEDIRERAMARRKTGSLLGAIYLLLGAALLGSALFAPWYFYDGQWTGWCGSDSCIAGPRDTTFYLTSIPGNGPVQSSCPGWYAPNICPLSTSYTGAWFNSTGRVSSLALALMTLAFLASGFAGILGVILRRSTRWTSYGLALAVVALTLAIAATASFATLLPGAFGQDIPAAKHLAETNGPWSSFYGSETFHITMPCTRSGCPPEVASWGPGIGWALAVAAAAMLLVGLLMSIRFQHDAASPAPAAASAKGMHEPNT